MKKLYRYHSQATKMAESLESPYHQEKYGCDITMDFDVEDAKLQDASGQTNCYINDDGDIIAWWEED